MSDAAERPRLFLVTPERVDLATFPAALAETLAAAEIAAVLVASGAGQPAEATARALVPVIQRGGAAALIADDTRIAGRVQADGVQIGTGLEDLRAAKQSFGKSRSVGAGDLHSRHAAMEAGEVDPDYLFFGRPHGDTHEAPHPKALDLAEWWSEVTEIPAVVMLGRSLGGVPEAVATGAAFVALHHAVWQHEGGPAEAVRQAAASLAGVGRRAA